MYTIIDFNMPERNQEIATTPFSDVAEIMALGYAKYRYSNRVEGRLTDMRSIEVRDEAGRLLIEVGAVERKTIGRIGGNG